MKTWPKRVAIALAALISASACATAVPGDRVDWRCDNERAFSVRFKDGGAEVFAGGQLYQLPGAVSASGARYANGAVEYWEHQGQARLNGAHGGPYENCKR